MTDRNGEGGTEGPTTSSPGSWGLFWAIVALFLIHQVAVSLAIVVVAASVPRDNIAWTWREDPATPGSPRTPFSNWDGQHYLVLAKQGYAQAPAESIAFFPLFPLCISAVRLLIPDTQLAAFLVVTGAAFGFVLYLGRYAAHYAQGLGAFLVVLATLCFPSAFFLAVFYSEALFLLLLFGFLYHYRVARNLGSVLFAFLLPLSRGQGFFLVAAFFAYAGWKFVRGRRERWGYDLLNAAGFLAGMAAYFAFFWLTRGNAFAGLDAQKHFVFRNSLGNLLNPTHFLTYFFAPCPALFGYNNALIDKIFIVGMLLGTILVVRAGQGLPALFYLALTYCPATMGLGNSFTRFALAAFPLLALSYFAPRAGKGINWLLVVPVLLLFVLFQFVFARRFAAFVWIA